MQADISELPFKREKGLGGPSLSNLSTGSNGSTRSQNRVQVPKFLVKTFDILEEGKYSEYVAWNTKGDALVVKQVHGFTEVVLPTFFKHSNFASFVRQLNMYGFRRTDDKLTTFKQPYFQRGKRDKLAFIKRKVTSKQSASLNNQKEIKALLHEVKRLRQSQETYDKQVEELKQVNTDLERENHMMWEALNRAKARQNLLASKMEKIMLFLYRAYRKPKTGAIGYDSGGLPRLKDMSAGPDDEAAPLVDRANSLIYGLESSDRLLKSIDGNGKGLGLTQTGPLIQSPSSFEVQPINVDRDVMNDQGGAITLDTRALSLSPLNSISEKDKYYGLVKGMDQHLLDQDNTLERLNTVESMLEDPLDSFLDYTSPDQITSILDEAEDKVDFEEKEGEEDSEENLATETPKPTKRRRKN